MVQRLCHAGAHGVSWSPESIQPFTWRCCSTLCCLLVAKLIEIVMSGTCPHWQKDWKLLKWPWYYSTWLTSRPAWLEPHSESIGLMQKKKEPECINQGWYQFKVKSIFTDFFFLSISVEYLKWPLVTRQDVSWPICNLIPDINEYQLFPSSLVPYM